MSKEKTSQQIGSLAGKVLQSNTTATAKSLAASALAQRQPNAETSQEMASKASKVLSQSTATAESKKLAASVLTQTPNKKK